MTTKTAQHISSEWRPAAQGAGKLGYKGEISHMLAEDMTLTEAIRCHQKNWGLFTNDPDYHDVSHLILGMFTATHSPQDFLRQYQGTDEAEVYADAIENLIKQREPPYPGSGKTVDISINKFTQEIKKYALESSLHENESRVLALLISEHLEVSYGGIMELCNWNFNTLESTAKGCGINSNKLFNEAQKITTQDGRTFIIDTLLEDCTLPGKDDGFYSFEAYKIPSDAQIQELYDCIIPVIYKLHSNKKPLEEIKTRDLMTALRKTPANSNDALNEPHAK